MQVDGGGDDGLGPVGGVGEVSGGADFAALHFEEQNGLGLLAGNGVGFLRIVIDAQMVDEREESDEIFAAAGPAFADFFDGNVVTAVRDAAADAADVEVGAGQSAKPDLQAVAGAGGFFEERRDGASAEGCFEAVVLAAGDGLLEELLADLPGVGVGQRE